MPCAYGILTGVLCGVFLTLFLICSKVVAHFAFSLYEERNGALAVVCIITLVLLCCLLTAVIQTLCPSAKGSGVPLAEGNARGILRVKWLSTAAALIAGSLLAFASGMPLGSEGPSVGAGGLIGDGAARAMKQTDERRRCMITGGASAGLAVAFNAPLTGICFALEETHKRFSPLIFASAVSAVVAAVITSQLAFWGFGQIPYLDALGVGANLCVLSFLKPTAYKSVTAALAACGTAALCGICCAVIGIAFNRLIKLLSRLFGKIKSATLRLLPPFLTAAVCGLSLYTLAGGGEASLAELNVDTAAWLLFAMLAARFVSTALASGASATGGLFLPMITIGGLLGTLMAKMFSAWGVNDAYFANTVILCVCAYFAASVRAPITAVALSVELTGSFVNLLPCVIAVAVATVISDATKTEPLYERMLDDMKISATPINAKYRTARGTVTAKSSVAHRKISNVLWPYNSLVVGLERDGVEIVPDGETELLQGDRLTVRAEKVNPDAFISELSDLISIEQ